LFPRIYLALDNCFASKRWTEPREWMEIARDAGVFYIEASADNECDPLYSTPEALQDWIGAVCAASERMGVKVANLYSGHGTYATLGLGHTDLRVRDHIQHDWIEPMIRSAVALDAGLGFFCHAFPQSVLREPTLYAEAEADLYRRLAEVAEYAVEKGLSYLSVEQMYSPHQIPWTITGAQRFMQEVYRLRGAPLYLTLDTGHQIGQRHYLMPDRTQLEACVGASGQNAPDAGLGYLSPPASRDEVDTLVERLQARSYLFAAQDDGDLYAWLRQMGCYAPIIHLQQTDGSVSAHHPFTGKYNRNGIVQPEPVLKALLDAYDKPVLEGYPPRCREIYLTIEVFSGTAERPDDILAKISESAACWRRFVPQDGLTLDQLAGR